MVGGVLAVLLVSSVGLVGLLDADRSEQLLQWEARLGGMATDRALSVDRWVLERIGDARMLSESTALPMDRPSGRAPPVVGRLSTAVDAYGWDGIWVLAGDGSVLGMSAGAGEILPPEAALARAALTSGETRLRFLTDPERLVSFAVPVPHRDAVLVLRADPERYLFPLLRSEPLPTRTGETLLARMEGDSVVFLNTIRGYRPEATVRRSRGVDRMAMVSALQGRDTFGEFVDYDGVPVLAATRALTNAPWGLVVKVDRYEAMADHRALRNLLLLSIVGLALGVLGVSAAYWSRHRAREQAHASEALRRSEERYRLLFEQSRDAIFLTSPDGRFLDINPACVEMLALDPDRLDEYDVRRFYADPEDRERFRRIMLEEGGVADYEVELADADGNPFSALYSAAVWRDGDGEIIGFHGTVRDVSERKAAELRLRESEERFRLVFENSPIGKALVALDGAFSRVNPALCRMVGFTAEELLGRTFQEITHPDDLDEDLSYVEALLAGQIESYEMDKRYIHRDGHPVWVHLIAYLLRNEEGLPTQLVAHVHDVTEQVEARRKLQSSERRFRSLIESGSDLISLLDADGIIRYQSPAFKRILGFEEGALEEMDAFHLIHPEEREEILTIFRELRTRPGERTQVEYRFRHADGDWRILETRAVNLLHDPAVAGVVVNARDVTERRAAEAEVRRNRSDLRAILDTITEAVVFMDLEGRIVYANSAIQRILGMRPDQVVGLRFDSESWTILGPRGEELQEAELPFSRVASTGEPVYDVLLNVEVAGRGRLILRVNAAPLPDAEGDLAGVVASVADVTERVEAERQIRRLNAELEQRVRERTAELSAANQELEAFSYSVSHDLRQPLRALHGYSQALVEDYGGELQGEALQFLDRIQTNAQRMGQLIDDILKLSRVSRKELERKDVDLAALARERIRRLREGDPDRVVELVTPPSVPATADPQLLGVVLDNLLGNAWKFTEPRKPAVIELGVETGPGPRTYYVRDNGVGFDMQYADKLFKAFHRLHRDSEFEGTGIGLATVHRIIQRHGGDLRAEGAVGVGTTIWFTLGENHGRPAWSSPAP